MSFEQLTKEEIKDKIRPILKKGKVINDIVFLSKKITLLDVDFMLKALRPTRQQTNFGWLSRKKDNYFGMDGDELENMVDMDVWGGDGLEQLLFGCITALEVYTEEEILTVFVAQRQYKEAENRGGY